MSRCRRPMQVRWAADVCTLGATAYHGEGLVVPGTERSDHLVWMDVDLWRGGVKRRSEDDGLSRARSRALEALLQAYADGGLTALLPSESTYGKAKRGPCTVKLSEAVVQRAQARWKAENPDRRGGDPGLGLLCEILLRDYAEGRTVLRISAVPAKRGSDEEAA